MKNLTSKVFGLIAMLVLTGSAFAQRIAVLNFNAGVGVTQVEVDGLSAVFNTYFAPKGAEIVERTRVDRLLQEQKFQKSKFTNTDMVALGEMLNVSLIVVGDVNIVMEQYNVDVRVVNTQTGTIVAKDGASCTKSGSYRAMMQQLGERISKSLELEIEKLQINTNKSGSEQAKENKTLPKNMTTAITEDNSKRERTDIVEIYGYLKLYPEDLGEFRSKPSELIRRINAEAKYGYDTWRLPTETELDLIRSNGYLSGQKYMTNRDPEGVLLLVTTKDKKRIEKLPIKTHEFSLHAGLGLVLDDEGNLALSTSFKYKYKPFTNYDIRLLGEIQFNMCGYPVLPILVGVNYEYRIDKHWSFFADFGIGVGFNLEKDERFNFEKDEIGFSISPEIGLAYNKFMFSFLFSSNGSEFWEAKGCLFRLGYRF